MKFKEKINLMRKIKESGQELDEIVKIEQPTYVFTKD
jgi:hypothetical protein